MKKKVLLLLSTVLLVCLMSLPVMGRTFTKGSTAVASVTPYSTKTTYNYSYTQADSLNESDYGVVVPIKINSTGYFEVTGTMKAPQQNISTEVELFTDAACTKKPSDTLWCYLSGTSLSQTAYSYLAKGTYYLRISSDPYSSVTTFTNSGTVGLKFVSNADRSLANKTAAIISNKATGTFLKISVPYSGTITVTGTKGTSVCLYNSSKKMISYEYNTLGDDNGNKQTFTVGKGTYYIRTKNSAHVYWAYYTFAGNPTWKSGKTYSITPAYNQYYYAKFKPSKSGYLTLKYSGSYNTYMTLCNSSKKALTKEVYASKGYNDQKAVFAVKKNTTYYLKIKSSYGSKFTIKPTFTSVTEKSGSKISKAVSIKKGKTAKGLILPNSSTKDYYKLVVSKAQKVSIKITGKVYAGTVKVTIYSDKKMKKSLGSVSLYGGSSSGTYKLYTLGSSKLRKGTYYIKVERKDSKSNGYYTIKWNK